MHIAGEAPAPRPTSSFQCEAVSEDTYLRVLRGVVDALGDEVPFAFMGGLASAVYGRPRWTYDLDVFLRKEHAVEALRLLRRAGFATEQLDERWLYKAIAEGVLVDIIFRGTSGIYFDDEMSERTSRREFRGVWVPVIAPEDLIVIKATVHDEGRERHWFDALGILARTAIDWPYLIRRARHGVRRVASLMLYAQSSDIPVPNSVVRSLVEQAAA